MSHRKNIERTAPYSHDAEQAMLGAMLVSMSAIEKAQDIFPGSRVFYSPAHRKIYDAIMELHRKNQPADITTVAEILEKSNDLKDCGGRTYLSDLASGVATAANAEYYAGIIHEKYMLRELITISTDIIGLCYRQEKEAKELLDIAGQRIYDISMVRDARKTMHIQEVIGDAYLLIGERKDNKDHLIGCTTGYRELDDITAGFSKSDLIIVAGRPSMGKSALGLNLLDNFSTANPDRAAVYFSLEMSKEQLTIRALSTQSGLDGRDLQKGIISDSEISNLLFPAGTRLGHREIYLNDTAGIKLMEIRRQLREVARHAEIGFVGIDYLQLVRPNERKESRVQEVSAVSAGLKAIAKDFNVPVVAMSQLSRAVETRGQDHRPTLSDLRDSGTIENDADVIIFIYRPDYYLKHLDPKHPDRVAAKGLAYLFIDKQRNGPTGEVKLHFDPALTKFSNLAHPDRFPEPTNVTGERQDELPF